VLKDKVSGREGRESYAKDAKKKTKKMRMKKAQSLAAAIGSTFALTVYFFFLLPFASFA
jgi:hypothetical protein